MSAPSLLSTSGPSQTGPSLRSFVERACLFLGLLAFSATAAPPENDLLSASIPITGLPIHILGTTSEATVEPEEPTEIDPTFARRLERSVWYSWTAQKSGVVGIYYGLDAIRSLRIYTGNTWGELTAVPLAISPTHTGPSRNISFPTDWTFHAQYGVTYHIGVYDAGVFTLDFMERPDNDFFADRSEIPPPGARFTCTTSNATYEFNESIVTNKSVWYGWRPNFSGPAVLTLFGGGGTERLEAFNGTVLTQLQAVGTSPVGATLLLPLEVEIGQPYSIRVSGKPSAPFRLTIEHAPTNDNFASAISLSGYSISIEGTTWGTTPEPGEPPLDRDSFATATAWWKWVAPASGLLRVKPGSYNLYRGTELSALTPERLSPTYAGGAYADEYTVISNKTYYLRIYDSPLFRFEFTLYPRPANDDFTRREALNKLTGFANGQNHLATRQGGEPRHGGSRAGHSVWWTWTAPFSGHFYVATIGSDFNNVIAAYTGDNVKRLRLVADNRYRYWNGLLAFPVTGGNTYQIAVDGVMEPIEEVGLHTTRGSIELNYMLTTLQFAAPEPESIFVGPANVEFYLNTPVKAVDGNITGVEYFISHADSVQSVGAANAAPFSLTVTNITPGLHVFAAVATNHLGEERLVPPVVITVRPPNDNFSERIPLSSNPGIVRGWIGGGSWEPWEKRAGLFPANAGSSWWTWTAPETGTYQVQMLTYTSMVAYRGTTPGRLKPVKRFYYGNNVFDAVAGETYHLQAFSPARSPAEDVILDIAFSVTK